MTRLRYIFVFVLLNLSGFRLWAQYESVLNRLQDSIVVYAAKLNINTPDEVKDAASAKLVKLIGKAARQQNSIDFAFDSLRIVSVLTSEDKAIRIFTWLIPYSDGSFSYGGVVQAFNKRTKSYFVKVLKDKTPVISRPMRKILSADKWYGARYYRIITKKYRRRKYYTLLGWKGFDPVITRKVVEVISVKSNGTVVFGYNLFDLSDKEVPDYFKKNTRPKRLVFSFSSEAHMNLIYDNQTILKLVKKSKLKSVPIVQGFKAQKKEVRTKPKYKKIVGEMIVMDRLMPLNKSMTGIYQFYIPKINVLDALHFEKGKWRYYSDIDARNHGLTPEKKENIDYDLFEEKE